jgi:hypothetical protein
MGLGLGKLHGLRACLIIIRHVVDSGAYRVASHEAGIVGLQQFGDGRQILHPRSSQRSYLPGSRITGILS